MKKIYIAFLSFLFLSLFFIFLPQVFSEHVGVPVFSNDSKILTSSTLEIGGTSEEKIQPPFVPSYVPTPEPLYGVYMTSYVAGTHDLRDKLVEFMEKEKFNAIVIDVKDYSGKIAFEVSDPALKAYGSESIRVRDMQDFIESLHKKSIYVIARIAVFQDAFMVRERPDLAVKNKSGTDVWKDHKGISWIDPGSLEYWDYIVTLARETHKIGFDEINFDYIRFPSDGDMKNISYPFSSTTPKTEVLKNFFEYLHDELVLKDATTSPVRLKISADIFGQIVSATDDMGIGQYYENVLPYFDYVCPMIYPSHYTTNYLGFKNPENFPYEVVNHEMKSAVLRREALASSTPGSTLAELRPWLQDFGLKMDYGPKEVSDEVRAAYDTKVYSWLLWNAANRYTENISNF